ncbi:Hsp33 family molecular chaperone HslO [Kushneria marisflavi]|uniref:33 kDa chaperonin n=1 Tax=Kushneria marisflavi TaxID=157779 RepID=A0A240UR72_9GAMM|nr:Hsp33 family molecular chaperone HslO [Kushneria marisflavi]ART63978.1 Hsp33 family molecular chaperone [Kushneria marisflavi]RKD85701.1 molecular chaperone Hsp33 [Kushneria marisflavi]
MDHIQRFIFDDTNVRGELVKADDTCRDIIGRHNYPDVVNHQLSEMLAAVALLTATIKLDGVLTLEVKGNGPVSLLMAESNPARDDRGQQLRAIARLAEDQPLPDEGASLQTLMGEGHIVMTLDPRDGQRYQGIVAMESQTLAQCLESYFERSEQLPSRLWLSASKEHAAGLMLQTLPEDDTLKDIDAWPRLNMLADTLKSEELLELPAREVLVRLFHEEQIRVFEPDPIGFGCTCSRERFASALHQLGPKELRSVVKEQGELSTTCHFCNTDYLFNAADIEALIESPDAPSPTLH